MSDNPAVPQSPSADAPYSTTVDDTPARPMRVLSQTTDRIVIEVAGREYDIKIGHWQGDVLSASINGERATFAWQKEGHEYDIRVDGAGYTVEVLDAMMKKLRDLKAASGAGGDQKVKAPMPGVVVSIKVEKGQSVSKGVVLCVLEAMKMQNEIKAPADGVVSSISVIPGDSVGRNQEIAVISAPEA